MSARRDLPPKPQLGYVENALDRMSERRGDLGFVAGLEADPRAAAYAMVGELIVLKASPSGLDPLFALAEARALGGTEETVLLGVADGVGRFGVGISPIYAGALKLRTDLRLNDLRSIAVQGQASPTDLAAMAQAKALLLWHARHRFCSTCGAATKVVEAGWRRDCPNCQALHFPRTDPVVIMLATDNERCLLGRQSRFPRGMWSCLAGFVEPGESIEEAARRELREEAGIICGPVKYFASQPWPFPMSLMIGCHALAVSSAITVEKDELEDARWFDREEVAAMLLGQHPLGLIAPPPVAIAYHIIRAFIEGEVGPGS
jgi:NAD+ diphosphatase